jgi:NADH:ubiquinone oxidoreductase subunit H
MNLGRFQTGVATLLPLTGIVVMLSTLNLERAAFNIMGGIREKTSHDIAYQVLFMLSLISMALIAPLLIAYISVCSVRWRARKT